MCFERCPTRAGPAWSVTVVLTMAKRAIATAAKVGPAMELPNPVANLIPCLAVIAMVTLVGLVLFGLAIHRRSH